MADEVHPVPVVVLPADVPEAPPAAGPAPVSARFTRVQFS